MQNGEQKGLYFICTWQRSCFNLRSLIAAKARRFTLSVADTDSYGMFCGISGTASFALYSFAFFAVIVVETLHSMFALYSIETMTLNRVAKPTTTHLS